LLLFGEAALLVDSQPSGVPTLITEDVAEGQHGIETGFGPTHARLFHPSLHNHFVTTLSDARANG
jgi:hypothetical protein